jgi:hypothetical protein
LLVEIRIAVQGVGKGGGGSKGKEMTQTLYAHMNKRKKTTLKFYLTPVRMAIKKTTKAGGDAGVKGALLHHW